MFMFAATVIQDCTRMTFPTSLNSLHLARLGAYPTIQAVRI